ncbi:alpha/beta-hydrolase [Microthyrium microscopicum]|uniref:Alpha/beta-hydrolase n=1 Tax=Microthyrium microscopicum TaxID=703497 RepID=A0A6A6U517_9PEZI|nr:alpha/beta-hydrolase [Microthyrium microscopicum]
MLSSMSHFAFALLFLLQAKPLAALPLLQAPVSAEDLKAFSIFEQYSAAAYCPNNTEHADRKIRCDNESCPTVETAQTRTVLGLSEAGKSGVTGFLATDQTNNQIVLAFRGTDSYKNAMTDIDFFITNSSLCESCGVASGFSSAWNESRVLVMSILNQTKTKYPLSKIIVTGHSLGGALATLATAELRKNNVSVDMYTFGSPRVGNSAFANWMTSLPPSLGKSYRFTHMSDPVPQYPSTIIGYEHISPEYYISSPTNQTVKAADITELKSGESWSGNRQWFRMATADHGWYFGNITACSDGAAYPFPMGLGNLKGYGPGSIVTDSGWRSTDFTLPPDLNPSPGSVSTAPP